jgi:hypothetical protein
MTAMRLMIAALATATLATSAFAGDSSLIDDLDIDRINANQIEIEFEYDGSACEAVEPAQLGETVDGTLAVTFPTVSTAEVCTQQIVEIEVEQVIEADESVRMVEVTLLRPDGSVLATRTERVDND